MRSSRAPAEPGILLLAIEGGGSKTRIRLADTAGTVAAGATLGTGSPLYVRRASFLSALGRHLAEVRAATGPVGKVVLAGVAGPLDSAATEEAVRTVFGTVPVLRYSEADVGLAVYRLRSGVSLVAGTGSSCRVRDERGRTVTCGGLGPQFGDEGSGYWLGRAAIAAIGHARDGRGPATPLEGRLCAYLGIDTYWDLFRLVDRSGHLAAPRVAGFAPVVFDEAHRGDAVARSLCDRAGGHLARLVLDTLRQSRLRKRPAPLVLTGGVFHGGLLILDPLRRGLETGGETFDLHPVVTEPVTGLVNCLRLAWKERHGRVP